MITSTIVGFTFIKICTQSTIHWYNFSVHLAVAEFVAKVWVYVTMQSVG